ncbi:MAG TPA: ABC transporter permease, partial [Bryobacteraceae bacterium]|nr:ABC transporter permease [Bryobacteraceae bacterium]
FTAALRREFPNDYRPEAQWSVRLEPLQESLVGKVRPLLWVLLGAVAMMLLTGCANIANLLLARAAGRQREVAVRQALGAARGRLIRQWLTESLILSLFAGIFGVLAAASTLRFLLTLIPSRLPRMNEVGLDWRVLLFALAVSLITGILFGLAPALTAAGFSVAEHLKEATRGGTSRRQNFVSGVLVVVEFAICVVLTIGAGLLVRSFWKLTQLDPGFNAQNVMTLRIWIPVPNDPATDIYAKVDQRAVFTREVLRRVSALPGVAGAAVTTSIPLSGNINQLRFTVENHTMQSGESPIGDVVSVTPGYFTVLGAPLLEGRFFAETDQTGAPGAVIVDRATARKYWPNESAIGKRLKLGPLQSPRPWSAVVGVVGDIRHDGMDIDGVPHIYFPIYQINGKALGIVLRSQSNPASLGEAARREVQAVDPNLPVFGVRALDDMLSDSLSQRRFSAQLMAAFAALAILLAGVGIYGVLAYSISQRTREIGVRMALGARRSEVMRMIFWQGGRLILVGIGAGIASAFAFSRALSGLVYGVSLNDPLVFAGVPAVLIAVAAAASYFPARRATRIDPIIALRCE